MGQKVNPVGLRLGINRTWDSRWYAGGGDYGSLLHEDLEIRDQGRQAGANVLNTAVVEPEVECQEKRCKNK